MILDMKMKMEGSYESRNRNLQIIEYSSPYDESSCMKLSSFSLPWFDVRVFYVRVSGIQVNDESTSRFLYLHHVPLSPDTLLEINGVRSNMNNDEDSSILRRDRIDKKSEQVTFVNTDSIRLNGSVKFEICDKDQCILSCVLEMNKRFWSMNCETEMKPNSGFFKGKHVSVPELGCPEIEVYVAGCFLGTPIILTRTLEFNCRKKQNRKLGMLDVIPEYETTEYKKDVSDDHDHDHDHDGLDLQGSEYRKFKTEQEEDYNNMYWQRTGYMDMEDGGELSWFNAGVRVGVGIGLGICVGVGIGVGLLARSYQTTTRNFKRKFI
ncbi:uncharacterized protein At1g01500 [Lathyrus oleraceus]|uniref:Erythronate-4-phosphate dehydrogenase family protein n=1 Tax=Pisum sativum TaxID=3888 RepID=A0A9D4VZ16_PEA|nr:uncharacterized protein At1g01500-like [Pisum sativum]XP_050891198.1 uncharacterized protein At1g01500-like [Pisum sativum]KAI5392968.1 hypothetical protein KIW84_060209 [Pisum sativum]